MPQIAKEDVRLAVFAASSYSAGGIDGLPLVVWQKLWPVLKSQLTQLFQNSIKKGEIPEQRKVAKVIPLRKPNQPSYTILGTYRPISLLPRTNGSSQSCQDLKQPERRRQQHGLHTS